MLIAVTRISGPLTNQASIPFQIVRCISTRCKTCGSARTGTTRSYPPFCATTTPHLASGASIAIEDSIILARLLQSDHSLHAILDDFMDQRYERCRMVVQNSELLGEWEKKPRRTKREYGWSDRSFLSSPGQTRLGTGCLPWVKSRH